MVILKLYQKSFLLKTIKSIAAKLSYEKLSAEKFFC